MKRINFLLWTLSIELVIAGAWLGRTVPFAEQWPIFEALRTTASIIFAVIGAWLAIIYPERLKLSFRDAAAGSSASAGSGWTQLLTPVVHSTAILGVILVLGALAPILKHNPLAIDITYMRGASYGLLVTLTLWQLWTVVHTLVPADVMMTNEDLVQQRRVIMNSFGTPSTSPEREQTPPP
jgi:hypothetical protein